MIKVRIKKTGEIKEVLRNEAHRLIENGEAVLYTHRMMEAGRGSTTSKRKVKKGYITK